MISKNAMSDLIGRRAMLATCVNPFLGAGSGLRAGTFVPLTLVFRPVCDHLILQKYQKFQEYYISTIKPALHSVVVRYLRSISFLDSGENSHANDLNMDRKGASYSSRFGELLTTAASLHATKTPELAVHHTISLSHSFSVYRKILRKSIRGLSNRVSRDIGRSDILRTTTPNLTLSSHSKTTISATSPDLRSSNPPKSRISQSTRLSTNSLKIYEVRKRTHTLSQSEDWSYSRINTLSEEDYRFKKEMIVSDGGKPSLMNGGSGSKNTININREELYFSQQLQMNSEHEHSQQAGGGSQKSVTTNGVNKQPPQRHGFRNSDLGGQQTDVIRQGDLDKLIDIDRLTQTVMQKINKKIRIERERRGLL